MVALLRELDEHQPRRRTETKFAPLSVEERSYLEQSRTEEHVDDSADRVAFAIIAMSGLVLLAGIAAAAWVAWLIWR